MKGDPKVLDYLNAELTPSPGCAPIIGLHPSHAGSHDRPASNIWPHGRPAGSPVL
jgi:hypothetical protein